MSEEIGSTVFSLTRELPKPDAAVSADTPGFDAAELSGEGEASPCTVRKLTATGARLGLAEPIPRGESLQLQLHHGLQIAGTVWEQDGAEVGFRFDVPLDVVSVLARTLALHPAERRRVPRVELYQTVCVRRGGNVDFGRSRNVSQAGAGIETGIALQVGDAVQLTFDGLRPLDGAVKWSEGNAAGIGFDTEIPWQVLMPWLRSVQQGVGRSPAAHEQADLRFVLGSDARAIRLDTAARVREGVRWWNVRLKAVTSTFAEVESSAGFAPGASLWLWLPHIGGWPVKVVEGQGNRYLCEFRLPLRPHEMDLLARARPLLRA